jgi:hypothetical protein
MATMKQDIVYKLDDTNHFVTVLRGIMERQWDDIKDLRRRIDTLSRRFDTLEPRFDTLERRFDTMEQRFDTQDEKLDTILVLLRNGRDDS